ncbi:Uncharacterized protein DAT39_000242 [Clarias magur]|uniref:Uncharacterized protein n=1 Tax=Clarias magur TaxID=1594786 RepID=A0A8J4XHK6_CLAMG|nr:Uncharacterized protein DAT39_000242 [Clarias magur]
MMAEHHRLRHVVRRQIAAQTFHLIETAQTDPTREAVILQGSIIPTPFLTDLDRNSTFTCTLRQRKEKQQPATSTCQTVPRRKHTAEVAATLAGDNESGSATVVLQKHMTTHLRSLPRVPGEAMNLFFLTED